MMYSQQIREYLSGHRHSALDLRAVLFDMDGVLFDSMRGHAVAWVKAACDFGLPITEEEVYMNEGRTGAGTIDILTRRTWGRNATEQEIHDIYEVKARYFNRVGSDQVMPGAPEMLALVRDCGLQRVLVTGSGQKTLLERLNNYFPDIFSSELMVTAFDVKLGKPYPEPYLMGLQKAGLEPNQAIVVENAPLGVQAAVAAGIFTVAVNTGPLPDEVLWQAGASVVLPDVKAFTGFFPKFLECLQRL